jgi:hypothetical protein
VRGGATKDEMKGKKAIKKEKVFENYFDELFYTKY